MGGLNCLEYECVLGTKEVDLGFKLDEPLMRLNVFTEDYN